VNALAKEKVGAYLNSNFVSAYQKVGTFRLVDGQKQGGNVASYFCAPSGQVLHVIAGPVDESVFLREARWAVEMHKLAQLECGDNDARRKTFFRRVHQLRLLREHGYDIRTGAKRSSRPTLTGQGLVHRILTLHPLPKIEQVYKYVWQNVLNEKVSTAPVVEAPR
jgi:hypothetical protein